jgi:Fe-S cluster biosynthesis and repair protein YggX
MPRMVMCRKLGRELPGIPFKPFDDELGQRIYDEISMEAWQKWLNDSVKYVNTYRLDLADKNAQAFMRKQMAVYFGFEEGDMAQTAWVPPKA